MSALARWRALLEEWAIPEEILAAAPESPYVLPTEIFRQRAEAAVGRERSPSARRAWEALPEGGTVLDVGVGAGAGSLPLAPLASEIVGVDQSAEMLDAFRGAGEAAGVPTRGVLGAWPQAAGEAGPADVVVCNHVLYNVADLGPFVEALARSARHRVVIEIAERHPIAWMGDLWRRFHGIERPEGPTAGEAEAALRELGISPAREDHAPELRPGGFEHREDAVALIRRRLCLTAGRDEEIAAALGDRLRGSEGLWSAGPRTLTAVTLWWDSAGSLSGSGG